MAGPGRLQDHVQRADLVRPVGQRHPDALRTGRDRAGPQADPANPNVELLTYTLTEVDGGTELVYHQTGRLPAEQYPLIEQGVAGFYERLAQHLEQT